MGVNMTCKACQERVKNWNGDNPICSFPKGGEFDFNGWNCATANKIRDLTGQDEPSSYADYRYCDDQNYSTIKIDQIEEINALALWVTWYKHRGRTEGMWLLSQNEIPRKPTEADCITIIKALAP